MSCPAAAFVFDGEGGGVGGWGIGSDFKSCFPPSRPRVWLPFHRKKKKKFWGDVN